MILKNGEATAFRYDDGNLCLVYKFPVAGSMATLIPNMCAIDLKHRDSNSKSGKTRTFKFQDQEDCNKFLAAFQATQNWISK